MDKGHPVHYRNHNPYQGYKTLVKFCAQLERQYGLEVNNHTTQRNLTAGKVWDMDSHAGTVSLIRWIQQNALAQMFGDAEITDAMLDRIHHHCDILETGNDTYRFKQRRNGLKITKPGKISTAYTGTFQR